MNKLVATFKKIAMAAVAFGTAALCATSVHAGGFDGKPLATNDWFDVGFTNDDVGQLTGTTGIPTGKGSWTHIPSGGAEVVSDSGYYLVIDTDDNNPLTLTPTNLANTVSNETISVEVLATPSTDELEAPTGSPISAFALYDNGSSITPVAYVAGGWTNLVYSPGAEHLTNAWFTLYTDFATVGDTKYLRFSVEQNSTRTILKDSENETWFRAATNATNISSVSLTGSTSCRTISGDSIAYAVAEVNGTNYATFAEAISAAGGTYDIIVLDNAAAVPAGWKIADGKLVQIVYVAQIVGGNQYETIQEAINAASVGDTINILISHTVDSEIEVNKAVTISGQSMDGTILNSTINSTASSAFRVTANNVTIENLTINRPASVDNSRPYHINIGPSATLSNITVQNVKFTGGHYCLNLYASDFIIDSCVFDNPGSDAILLGCSAGDSQITNNEFVQTSPSGQGFIYCTNGRNYSSGTLTISGNVATKGRCLFHFLNWANIQESNKVTLNIVNNVATNYSNKGIVFASGSGYALGSLFNSITITNNVLFTSAKRTTIQRDDSDTSLPIDASYNYWGVSNPNFEEIIPDSDNKYYIVGNNIIHEPYYSTYDPTGTPAPALSDLRPLPLVAQIIRDNGATTNQYTTLAAAIAAAQDGDTIELLSNVVWDGTGSYYWLNAAGSVTIDGKGFTLSAPATGGPTDSAIMLGDSSSSGSPSVYTITNMTFSGFDSGDHSVVRCQGATANILDCTFTNNTISGVAWGVVSGENGTALSVKNCVFSGNTATKCVNIGFNVSSGCSLDVENCRFVDNTITDAGVIYVAGGVASATVQNSTFSNNTITASGAAVVYCSGTTTIVGNLFAGNRVTSTGKEGVIVLGSGSTGTVVSNNAFVDNTLGTTASHYATIYTGANCDISGNYWGDGAAAEIEDHKDVYDSDTHTIANTTFATAYAVNESGNGVTVTLYFDPVATVTINGVTTNYGDLHDALEAGKAQGAVVTMLADVDLDGIDWEPVAGFCGIFDGAGHTISNLTINRPSANNVGLIGTTSAESGATPPTTIMNVILVDPTVIGCIDVGTLVGKIYNCGIVNCHVIGDISVTGYNCVGGFAGEASYAAISNCSVVATSKATSVIEGIRDPNIEDGDNIGGFIGMKGVSQNKDLSKEATVDCSVKNLTVKGWRKVGGMYGQASTCESTIRAEVDNIDIVLTCDESFASSKESTLGAGGIAGIFNYTAPATYREGSVSGTVSNVNITCAYTAVDAYAKMGIISGGNRDSAAIGIPQDINFSVTVGGTNSTSGDKVTNDKVAIYSAKHVGYSTGEDIQESIGSTSNVVLTATEANYLNAILENNTNDCDKAAVDGILESMTVEEFKEAVLLNIDITNPNVKTFEPVFEITSIKRNRENDTVTVKVLLDRKGYELSDHIYGVLRLMTSSDAKEWKPGSQVVISDDDFSEGNESLFTLPIGKNDRIFKAIIVDSAEAAALDAAAAAAGND